MAVSKFLNTQPVVCPAELLEQAKSVKSLARVAIANAGAPLPMLAAKQGTNFGLIEPLFVGNPQDIHQQAELLEWDISNFQILPAKNEIEAANIAANACGFGRADVLMKGQLHTDIFIKSLLNRDNGLRTSSRLVHVFYITHPDGGPAMLVSDCAINVAPDLATRQASLQMMVSMLHKLGVSTPKIAILSATETPIESVPSSIQARELRDWARENIADAEFSGPLALDLILSLQATAIKGLSTDPVAGQADAILVPSIETGNAIFKSLVYLSGGCAAGVVMGAKVPVLLTSRADPPAARLSAIALSAILA